MYEWLVEFTVSAIAACFWFAVGYRKGIKSLEHPYKWKCNVCGLKVSSTDHSFVLKFADDHKEKIHP